MEICEDAKKRMIRHYKREKEQIEYWSNLLLDNKPGFEEKFIIMNLNDSIKRFKGAKNKIKKWGIEGRI